ncbi:iron chaperone [Microbacterium sp.]|uniref:iron chaperone n=1 Tax=Microbacterium sp. TaxID=51671 RepID=UPI0039E6A153
MTERDTKSGFSDTEREAMQQRAAELKAMKNVKGAAKKAKELEACLAAIEALEGTDRQIAERLHVMVSEEAPGLDPKTWYGFPTYAKDGKNIVFYQPASKFGTRYGTVNFAEDAAIDDDEMWAVSFALLEMTSAAEKQLRALIAKAVA